MIRIEVTDAELQEAIREKSPQWQTKAREKLEASRKAGKIGEGDGIWSEIKEVFILLQEFKCIYCEFPLPKVESTSAIKVAVDYDVEHYRPKNRVTSWPTPEVLARRPSVATYQAQVFAGAPAGYLRLAFDPFNYVVSCKVCNTSYKADRFPIAAKPDARSKKRTSLDAKERPLLLFPFGEAGDIPEQYLVFDGALVRPRPEPGPDRLRAQTVVDFFELDTREGLLAGRCLMIQLLWPKLEKQASADPQERAWANDFIDVVQQDHHLPHTACGRAFIKLYDRDRDRALLWYRAADKFLMSKDPEVLRALVA